MVGLRWMWRVAAVAALGVAVVACDPAPPKDSTAGTDPVVSAVSSESSTTAAPSTTEAPSTTAAPDATPAPTPPPTPAPTPPPTPAPTPAPTPPPTPAPTAPPTVPPTTPAPTLPPTTAASSGHPAGTTGRCNDGSYTSAAHSQGACSHHGGLAEYWG
jgi:hypothetical protein